MTVLPFWSPFLLNASAFGRDAWTQPVHARGHCHTRADTVTRACGHAREATTREFACLCAATSHSPDSTDRHLGPGGQGPR